MSTTHPSSRSAGSPRPILADLDPLPLILFDDPCALRQPSVDALRAAGIAWHVVCESQDLAGVQSAVRAKLGVTLLPVVEGVPDGMRVVADLPEPPPFTLRVRTGDAVLQEVSEAAQAAIGDIARRGAGVRV